MGQWVFASVWTSNFGLIPQQIRRSNAQCNCQLFDVIDRDISRTTLNMSHKSPMETSFKCQPLLRKPTGGPEQSKVAGKALPC